MIDRIRAFLPIETIEGKPRDWEARVAQSYGFLKNELQFTEEAMASGDFSVVQRAIRIKGRVGNLKDVVLEAAREYKSGFHFSHHISVKPADEYFYIPDQNKLQTGTEKRSFPSDYLDIGVTRGVELIGAQDVDDKYWCLNQPLVEAIAIELISVLPKDSSRRILNPITSNS